MKFPEKQSFWVPGEICLPGGVETIGRERWSGEGGGRWFLTFFSQTDLPMAYHTTVVINYADLNIAFQPKALISEEDT